MTHQQSMVGQFEFVSQLAGSGSHCHDGKSGCDGKLLKEKAHQFFRATQ
jgi:hypothetical protein